MSKPETRILIVDDEEGIRQTLKAILEDEGHAVKVAESAEAARPMLQNDEYDVVFLDIWLPGKDGLQFFKEERPLFDQAAVIMISGHGTIDMAVQAIKGGAFDFVEKPLSLEQVIASVSAAAELSSLRRENSRLRARIRDEDALVGQSPASEAIKRMVRQAAGNTVPVFISGENGTGKELVARTIHRNSARNTKPFIAVNCAAIPESLIESELFGHEKGAFTGAIAQKKGRFELAHGGSLFLDEVLDLSPSAQAKLLRVLQEMEFERVGGEKAVKVDVRIIAASNKDVHAEVREGRFREDLFYRLHVLPIAVPPLRDRSRDIPLLTHHFLALESDAQARPSPEITAAAMDLLVDYPWPGNIRQLRNIIQRLLVLCDETIDEGLVRDALDLDGTGHRVSPTASDEDFWHKVGTMTLQEAKDAFEERFLLQKLLEHGYNVTRTANDLAMYPSNLHAKIRKYRFQR